MYSEIQILANIEKNDIETAKKYLKSNILEKQLKEGSKSASKSKILANIVKRCQADKDINDSFKHVHTYGNKFAFMDGYMIIFEDENYGMKALSQEESMNFDKIINLTDINSNNLIDSIDLDHFNKFYPLLKSKLKTKEIRKEDMIYVMYKNGNPYSVFNADKLKDIIDYFKDVEIKMYQQSEKAPLLICVKGEVRCLLCATSCKDIQGLLEKQRGYYV